jgi:hypothetical protein
MKNFVNFHTSPNIIIVFESRRIRWAECLERVEKLRNDYSKLIGKPEEIDHLRNLDIDGRTVLM